MNRVGGLLAITLAWSLLSVASGQTHTPGEKVNKDFGRFAKPFLARHCL